MAFGVVAVGLTVATHCKRYLVLRYSFHSIIQFLSSKELSPPSLLVKTFSIYFPFPCTPNFPCSLFFYPEYGSSRFLQSARKFYNTTQHHIHQESTLHIHCLVSPRFCAISKRGSCRSISQIIPIFYKIKSFQGLLPQQ